MQPLKIGFFCEAIPFGILVGLVVTGLNMLFIGITEYGNFSSIAGAILMAPLALLLAGIPAMLLGFVPLLAGLIVYGQLLQNVERARSLLFLTVPALIIAGLIILPLRWFSHLELNNASLWPAMIGSLFGSAAACWDFRRLYLGGKGVWS